MVAGDKMENIANLKLTKHKFRSYLQAKFGSAIADKACLTLDFNVPMDYPTYCKQLEQLAGERKLLLQLAFDVFDSNNEGMVSELDLFKLLFQFNKQNLDFVSCVQVLLTDFSRITKLFKQQSESKFQKVLKDNDFDATYTARLLDPRNL